MSAAVREVRVLVTPGGLAGAELRAEAVLVVDVLRACTTIAFALGAGARGIVPVGTVEEASRLAASLGREEVLLGGEREGVRVEGFDLGNSPGEYTPEKVAERTIVFSTTSGSGALAAGARAQECMAASLVTLGACARRAARFERALIACAGRSGFFSLEDFLCAGLLVDEILREAPGGVRLDDGARAALEAARRPGEELHEVLLGTDHGRDLLRLGFREDVALACERDRFPFVPLLRDGRLVAADVQGAPVSPR